MEVQQRHSGSGTSRRESSNTKRNITHLEINLSQVSLFLRAKGTLIPQIQKKKRSALSAREAISVLIKFGVNDVLVVGRSKCLSNCHMQPKTSHRRGAEFAETLKLFLRVLCDSAVKNISHHLHKTTTDVFCFPPCHDKLLFPFEIFHSGLPLLIYTFA